MSIATLPTLIDELRQVLGIDGVLSAHADLVVYECDGFVIEKNCPDVVVFPRTAAASFRRRAAGEQTSRAVCAARGRHQFGRRMSAGRRRHDDCADADEGDRGNQSPRSVRRRAAGRSECLAQSGAQGDRLPLCSRSIEPGSLHHRRQRGHEQRRAAHAEIRRDGESRAGRRSRTGRWTASCNSAARRKMRRAWIWSERLVGSEGTLAIVTKSLGPSDARSARLSHAAGSLRFGRRRHEHDQRNHRRRHHSRGAGDDGSRNSRRGGTGVQIWFSARCPGDFAD